MYKVLPRVVQLWRYSHVKKKRYFFSKPWSCREYSDCHHVIKSVPPKVELFADHDGTCIARWNE